MEKVIQLFENTRLLFQIIGALFVVIIVIYVAGFLYYVFKHRSEIFPKRIPTKKISGKIKPTN